MNRFQLKVIAIIAMTINHIGTIFEWSGSARWFSLAIGFITFPIMTYLMTDSIKYTKNIHRLRARLAIFALLTTPIYAWAFDEYWVFNNVLWTFLLMTYAQKYTYVAWLLSQGSDWGTLGIPTFTFIRKYPKRTLLGIGLFNLLNVVLVKPIDWIAFTAPVGLVLTYLCLAFYNKKPGKYKLPYFFYIYYPAHLLILCVVKLLLQKGI